MVALFIVSTEEAAGKTAIAAGISKRLLGEGKKLSFLKPAFPSQEGDAAFMKQLLRLAESADELSPSVEGTREVADRVGAGKDVVLVEGRCGQSPQSGMSRDAYQLVAALKAKV
ncbi:MAG: AAA family ATPase, partial [Chloroflexota bacterium]